MTGSARQTRDHNHRPIVMNDGLCSPASFTKKRVLQTDQDLRRSSENKCIAAEIERRIAAVDCPMMIRTDEHQIRQRVVASAAQPTHMMGLAKLRAVTAPRRPSADLTFAGIEFSKLFDQIAVPMNDLHQILASLLCETGRFLVEKARNRVLVASQQQRLQPFLGKQPSPRLERQRRSISEQANVTSFIQGADGRFALKGATQNVGAGSHCKAADKRGKGKSRRQHGETHR